MGQKYAIAANRRQWTSDYQPAVAGSNFIGELLLPNFTLRIEVDGNIWQVRVADPRELQQILDEGIHPRGRCDDAVKIKAALLVDLVCIVRTQDLGVTLQISQRRPEIVGHGITHALEGLDAL